MDVKDSKETFAMKGLDIDQFNKAKSEANDNLAIKLQERKNKWTQMSDTLINNVKSRDPEVIQETLALALSYMHIASDEIQNEMQSLAKIESIRRQVWRLRFNHWGNDKFKITKGDRDRLIDADMTEILRELSIHESFVEYLRTTRDLFRDIQWAIKNKVEIAKYFE